MTRWAAEPLDLLPELRELKPAVVHFSGHGAEEGLYFASANGRRKVITPEALAQTLDAAGSSVRLVVLSDAGAVLAVDRSPQFRDVTPQACGDCRRPRQPGPRNCLSPSVLVLPCRCGDDPSALDRVESSVVPGR